MPTKKREPSAEAQRIANNIVNVCRRFPGDDEEHARACAMTLEVYAAKKVREELDLVCEYISPASDAQAIREGLHRVRH